MSRNTIPISQDILDALTSLRSNNERIQNNFLSSRIANSSGLDVLHEYGARVQSPSWSDRNNASSLTPSNTTSLYLNSVDEEDEYLYGDSNSIPEEQASVEEISIFNNTGTEWSDEEDPYIETRGNTNKLNSRLTNKTDSDYQNKTQDVANFSHIKRDDNPIESREYSTETPEQRYASHKLEYDDSVLSPSIEKNQFPEISQNKAKSKYHAAAEVLKRRAVDKANVINNNSSENLGTFPGSSKDISELNKSVQDWKTDKLPVKRPTPILNQKHVDNIRDYLTAPQRKRSYPPEEFVPDKYPRYDSSRNSPSRYHSPPKSSMPSYKYSSLRKYSESDRIKYTSSSSRYRSPSFETEKRHSRYLESHRRHSPSPKRYSRSPDYRHRGRSRERITDYNRHKDRSPRSRRSRSRSPGYYSSSRKSTYDKKTCKSPKKSNSYSKKKDKSNYSSGDSFCSLSLDSSSSSSDSSDESSDEKKKSTKPTVKTVSKDNKKQEKEVADLKSSNDTHSKITDSTLESNDVSKVSNVFNVKENSDLLNSLLNAFQPNKEQQLLMNLLEQMTPPQQQQPIVTSNSSTFASPTVGNINIASNLQMPVIPSSESYAYSTIPSAPVQYVTPQMTNFSTIVPSATFPTPVMAAATPPSQYGPYLPMSSVSPNDSQYITNISKSVNVRPSALRTIQMSDDVHIPPASSSDITVPKDTSNKKWPEKSKTEESKSKERSKLQESNKDRSKNQESNNKDRSKNQESKNKEKSAQESEKKSSYSKEKGIEKNVCSSPKLGESTSEQNRLLIIERFKKLKANRAKALYKAKSASDDLDEMRRKLDETFGKKISASEKFLYTKCKNQFTISVDIANHANRDARCADDILQNFKSKLPTALQAEVSKIKLEHCKDEPVTTNERISCLDQGEHLCCDCYIHFPNVKDFLNHILSSEHKEQMEASKQEWKKDFIREEKQDAKEESKKVSLKAVKGAEFVKPLSAFYCSLCKEVLIDESYTEQHLKGHQHFVNYECHLKKYPIYPYILEKNLIEVKILDDTCKRKKQKVDEDSKDNPDSSSGEENLSHVQKILAGKKTKNELSSKSVKASKVVTKTAHKYVFIGKNPAYKKKIAEKDKPWYKRESILKKDKETIQLTKEHKKNFRK